MKIGASAVLGCGRTELLVRNLDLQRRQREATGRGHELVVYEDAPPDVAARVAGALDETVRVVTRQDRRAFADALAHAGCNRSSVDFALLTRSPAGTYGANRNTFVLDQVGGWALCSDDDALPRVVAAPDRAAPRCSAACPLEYWPGSTATPDDGDPIDALEIAESVLGIRARELVDDAPASCAEARVAVAAFGVCGDAGVGDGLFALQQRGASRRRLVEGGGYRARAGSRDMLRVAPGLVLGTGGFFMAGAAAYDLTEFVPPFFPFGRNEDGLFGTMLRTIGRERIIAHLPWAMGHDPPRDRALPADTRGYQPPRICDLLRMLAHSCREALPSGTAARRSVAFGRRLCELAAVTPEALAGTLSWAWWSLMHEFGRRLRALAQEHAGPRDWVDDVQTFLRQLAEARARDTDPLPVEAATLGATRDALDRYGRLLIDWPTILGAARHLREQGIRMGDHGSPPPRRSGAYLGSRTCPP